MTHETARALLPDLAIGELSQHERKSLEQHLSTCPQCQSDLEYFRNLYAQLQEARSAPVTTPAPVWQATGKKPEKPVPNTKYPIPKFGFFLFAVCSFLLVTILPISGWFVRQQVGTILRLGGEQLSSEASTDVAPDEAETPNITAVVVTDVFSRRSPTDPYLDDLGAALSIASQEAQLSALQRLILRYPKKPELRALVLLFSNPLSVKEEEGIWIPRPDVPDTMEQPPAVRAFLREAAIGEQLDPDNALFPLLMAYGRLAAGQPQVAMEAIRRAGTRSYFKDYRTEQLTALSVHQARVSGETGAFFRYEKVGDYFFRGSALLRQLGRMTSNYAMGLEVLSRQEEALTLRMALLHCGDLLLSNNSYWSNLIGQSILTLAINRPNASLLIPQKNIPSVEIKEQRIRAFADYARRLGHPEVEVTVRALFQKQDTWWNLFERALEKFRYPSIPTIEWYPRVPGLEWYAVFTALAFVLLFALLWTAILAGITHVAARSPRIQRGEAIPSPVGYGLVLSVTPLLIWFGYSNIGTPVGELISLPLLGIGIGLVLYSAVSCFRLRLEGHTTARNFGSMLGTMFALYTLLLLMAFVLWEPVTLTEYMVSTIVSGWHKTPINPLGLRITVAVATSLIPVLALLISGWVSRSREVPFSTRMMQRFPRWALPLSSVLLLLYASLALFIGFENARLHRDIDAYIQNEYTHLESLLKR